MARTPAANSSGAALSKTSAPTSSQVTVQDWFVTSVPSSNRSSARGPLRVWGIPWPRRVPVGVSKRSKHWLWRSSSVGRRISATEVETRFGTRINLRGPLHERSARKVCMTEAAISAFRDGFPRNWRVASVDAFNVVARRARDPPSPTPQEPPTQPPARRREIAVTAARRLGKKAKNVATKAMAHRRANNAKALFPAASDFAAPVDLVQSKVPVRFAARPPRPTHTKNTRGPRDRFRRRMREGASSLVAVPISDVATMRASANAKHILSKRLLEDAASVEREGSPRKMLKIDSGRRHARFRSPQPVHKDDEDEETEEEEDCSSGEVPASALVAFKVAMQRTSPASEPIVLVPFSGRSRSKAADYLSIGAAAVPATNASVPQISKFVATNKRKTSREGTSAAKTSLKRASRRLQSLSSSVSEDTEAVNPNTKGKSNSKSLRNSHRERRTRSSTRVQAPTGAATAANSISRGERTQAAKGEGRFTEYTRRLKNARPNNGRGRTAEVAGRASAVNDTASKGEAVRTKSKSVVKPSRRTAPMKKSESHEVPKRPRATMRRVAFTDELDSVEEVVRPSSGGRRAARLARALGQKSALRRPRSPPPANLSARSTGERAPVAVAPAVVAPVLGLNAGAAAGIANGFWSAGQVTAYEHMRSSVPGDRPDYWTAVAAGVPGRTAEECHARWAASWVSPVKRAPRATVGGSKAMSTPEIAAHIARVAPTKEHRKTAKFRTNMRRIAAAAARSADDAEFEPVLTDGEASSLQVTPRFAVPDLPDGTPGSLIREKRKELDEAGRIETPEILARGRAVGLAEADKFVALFKKRLAKAARRKDEQASGAARPVDPADDVGPVARDLLKEMKELEKKDKPRLSLGSEVESPDQAELEEDPDLFF